MCLISESSHWIRKGGAVLVPNEVGFQMRECVAVVCPTTCTVLIVWTT